MGREFICGLLLFLGATGAAMAGPVPAGALNVRDYGAKGDGSTDDALALNRALADAIHHGPGTVLFFPAGTYAINKRALVTDSQAGATWLGINHADRLTVEGETGTVLLCRNLAQNLFRVKDSQGVTIKNLTVDASPFDFTQGTITAYNQADGTLEMQVDAGFDDLDRPDMMNNRSFRFYDSPYALGFKESQYFPYLERRVRLGPGHWRLTPAAVSRKTYHDYGPGLVGKKWMVWADGYRGWTFGITHCSDCTVENVTIFQCGSGGFDLTDNGNITIRHDTIGAPPGSNRIFAGGGGAMSFFNRGTVTVEDCDFSLIDDDGFNLGTHFVRVLGSTDPQSCRTEIFGGDFVVGDTISLWDWQKKVVRGEAKLTGAEKVTGADKDAAGEWTLHFDHPLTFVTMGPGDPKAALKIKMVDGIDRLIDFESAGSCILRRNRISSLRARCFLVKTPHSVIEDNFLHDTHMPGILAGPEFFWGEGGQLQGLTIRRNTFENIDAPNISIATFDAPTGSANRDVTIEDNTFEHYGRMPVVYMAKDPPGLAMQIRNTDGLTIQNNHIVPPDAGVPKVNPIVVTTSQNVRNSP